MFLCLLKSFFLIIRDSHFFSLPSARPDGNEQIHLHIICTNDEVIKEFILSFCPRFGKEEALIKL